MFEQSLVESTGVIRTHNRKPAVISVSVQLLLVTALLIWPLMHPEVVLPRTLPMTLFAPPKPPVPQPPPQRVHLVETSSPTAPTMAATTATPRIPTQPATRSSDAPPVLSQIQIGGNSSDSALPFALAPSSSGPAIAVVSTMPTRPRGTLALSTGVSTGLLLTPIQPIYPVIAKQVHMQGTVVVSAVISKSGHIESARATSGPEMLRNAAVDSVRLARYKPFLLNGQPTEVEATFSIHFQLNQ